MLVQLAIETEAIDNSATPAHIKRLLDHWERFGILVYPRRGDPALVNTIADLAPTPRKHWKTAWATAAKNNGNAYRWVRGDGPAFEWNKVDTPEALASVHHEFELAVLEESRAADLEVPVGESRRCGKVEGIRLRDFDVSEEFSRSKTLGSAAIDCDDSIKDIWNRRFQRFAAHSRKIVVVDQWAVRGNNLDGILQLLRLLDRDARGCRVTIYSRPDGGGRGTSRVERKVRAEIARLSGRGVASVGVRLFRRKDFQKYAHDRHLRFDNSVFGLGRGMRVFEDPYTKEATDVHFSVLKPGTPEEKEMNLERSGKLVGGFRVRV